eukprot:scaffold19779_cov164-Isochrysis_galbana.AAC.1
MRLPRSRTYVRDGDGAPDFLLVVGPRLGIGRKERRGSYERSTESGKGIREPWADSAARHLASLGAEGSFFQLDTCAESPRMPANVRVCPRGGRCKHFVPMVDIIYGLPVVDVRRP